MDVEFCAKISSSNKKISRRSPVNPIHRDERENVENVISRNNIQANDAVRKSLYDFASLQPRKHNTDARKKKKKKEEKTNCANSIICRRFFFLRSQITPTRSWLFYRNSINCTLLAYARDTVWVVVEFANPTTIKKGSGGGNGVGRLGYMPSVCENWFWWRCSRGHDVYTRNKARKVEFRPYPLSFIESICPETICCLFVESNRLPVGKNFHRGE